MKHKTHGKIMISYSKVKRDLRPIIVFEFTVLNVSKSILSRHFIFLIEC